MSAADWEDLKEEICIQLLIGKENGEAALETMARIVWLERQKCLTLIISEQLRKAAVAALEAVEKTVTSPIAQERGVGFPKGKVLRWKTRSRSVGESAFATSSGTGLHPLIGVVSSLKLSPRMLDKPKVNRLAQPRQPLVTMVGQRGQDTEPAPPLLRGSQTQPCSSSARSEAHPHGTAATSDVSTPRLLVDEHARPPGIRPAHLPSRPCRLVG
jgi:hypothetical protein